MGRIETLRSGLDLGSMTGIEIGPLLQPVVTRSEGDIIYVDHLDTELLKAKYADDQNVDTSKIVSVDAVWGSQTLSQAVGRLVDYVIAPHVAEHVPESRRPGLERSERRCVLAGRFGSLSPINDLPSILIAEKPSLQMFLRHMSSKARAPLPRAIIDVVSHDTRVDLTAVWDGRYQPEKRTNDVACGRSNLPAMRTKMAPIVTCIAGFSRRLGSAVFLSVSPSRAWCDLLP